MCDQEDGYDVCPECTIAYLGWSRQAAFDAAFATGPLAEVRTKRKGMVRCRIVRNITANRADPTSVNLLACGHAVM